MRIPGWLTGRGRQAVSTPATGTQVGQGGASGFYAVRSGRDMMQTSERQRLIRMLSDNSPLSGPLTQTWWLRPLEELAARVQACPAAWSGPFSGPGGFTDLSLNVAVRAVRLVRGMMLPPGATPEAQSEQGPGWVCAVYWAGLLHHLDWLTQMEGEVQGGRAWYPGLTLPQAAWRVRPGTESRPMRGTYMALTLLPADGLVWLQRWPALSESLLTFLSGQRARSGILNGIISDALTSCGMRMDMSQDKLSETAAESGSGITDALPPSAPIKTDADTCTLLPESNQGALPDTASVSSLASALGADEAVRPTTENGDSAGEGQDGRPDTRGLLSLLDLMAEGKNVSDPDGAVTADPDETRAPLVVENAIEATRPEADSLGDAFLAWLRAGVEDGTLTVNGQDSILPVLAQFVFMVSPGCFYRYAASDGSLTTDKDALQKSFEALGIHHSRKGKGLFHYHQYDSPDKSGRYTRVSGYMISADLILKKESCPADSIWFSAKK
ncbi:helicase/relaxase domain-containing protein [Erwinia tracheiphila]|uniref:Membrane protein n=2 Tax=Erwinia tracheiphila TaxID=65700 RepID=A0A0M2KF12_9GAMM|nr:TraI domain-containing protein [Erwinia tracheiphila]KKF37965.1 membrane protein [Erwinia tracheiphila]UIA90022.1 helicase/relaxase domain-containing protein [Erwinia tracheiphila]UIA98549.1 helicase/relaxase domain-containing protein [Erwinia tracheiphila]